jgi:HlyD family secretion protein
LERPARIRDRAGGPFQLRSVTRTEVRAPVAGIVREVRGEEGSRVDAGAVIAVLEIPDLASRIAEKSAERDEARARLALLEAGTRAEERAGQRRRVEVATAGRDMAAQHLTRAAEAHRAELARLESVVTQARAEMQFAVEQLENRRRLQGQGAASPAEISEAVKNLDVARALLTQAEAQSRVRQALGTQEAEAELARREKDLADEAAKRTLLEAGPRTDEVEAERAHLARVQEQLNHLTRLREQTRVVARTAGVIVTPRVADKVGSFLRENDLIAVIEEAGTLEADVALPEGETTRLAVGQPVRLQLRAFPNDSFPGSVVRVSPAARPGDPAKVEDPGTVTATCRLDAPLAGVRPGMTGYARIYSDDRSVGGYLLDRAARLVRTEYWW